MSVKDKAKPLTLNLVNRKAKFDFEFIETFTAGIILAGTEVKAVRDAKVSMVDAYCYFVKGELFIKNLHIGEYKHGNIYNHEPLRVRKLLLNKKELKKLETKIKEKGLTIIPYKVFLSDRGIVKLEIALSKGKKSFDKRETLKTRDNDLMIKKILNQRR